jgi:hypothetical protein
LSRRSSCILALPLLVLALPRAATAQTFPAANAYVALPCGAGPMVDPAGDTPNAAGALDLVGTDPSPAGFHAADGQFLYLRMRVAGNPINGARLMPNAWGYEFDFNNDNTTYELLISVSGTGATDQVAIYRHPTTVVADSPADPSVTPPAFSYPFATHGQVLGAGTSLGGGADSFIDLAVPWADLASLGLVQSMPVRVWAGSSTMPNFLDLDLACFGGPGGTLSGIDVTVTTPDPSFSGSGGLDDIIPSGPRTLEGGPGCSLAIAGAPAIGWLAIAILVLALARRRARS